MFSLNITYLAIKILHPSGNLALDMNCVLAGVVLMAAIAYPMMADGWMVPPVGWRGRYSRRIQNYANFGSLSIMN